MEKRICAVEETVQKYFAPQLQKQSHPNIQISRIHNLLIASRTFCNDLQPVNSKNSTVNGENCGATSLSSARKGMADRCSLIIGLIVKRQLPCFCFALGKCMKWRRGEILHSIVSKRQIRSKSRRSLSSWQLMKLRKKLVSRRSHPSNGHPSQFLVFPSSSSFPNCLKRSFCQASIAIRAR